jgi:hypothetical protein
MSGRLVGEVVEWLRTPAAVGLTVAERAVLLVIAERANEKDNRKMWWHRGDDCTLFELICEVTGMDRSGLTKVLKKLAAHGVEVRVQIGTTKAGGPVFAHRGVAMRFRLPALPASVTLPERVDERGPIPPVDNSTEGPSGASSSGEKDSPSGDPFDGKGGRAGTQTARKGGREGTPNTSKDIPSTTDPSSCGSPKWVAEEEGTPPATATSTSQTGHQHMGWEPTYKEARAILERLPDLGGTYMTSARDTLGQETPLAELVIYAAQLAKEAMAS